MKTHVFAGNNAGEIITQAESLDLAWDMAIGTECYSANCSGNNPQLTYIGQKMWEVSGSLYGSRMFDTPEEARQEYNKIIKHDNCGMGAVIINK
jgi:hypothetical protein